MVQFYRVEEAVITATGATVTCDQSSDRLRSVLVDVINGQWAGHWFLATLERDGALSSCPVSVQVGDDITVGYACDVIDLGRGTYELEEDEATPWGQTFDLVLGSNHSPAWLGCPGAQLKFKVYAASTILTSLRGPEPTDQMFFHADEILPHGALIDYHLVAMTEVAGTRQDRDQQHSLAGTKTSFGPWDAQNYKLRSFPIYAGEPVTLHQLLERVRFKEELPLDRTLSVELTYQPAVDPEVLQANRYADNPNLGGSYNSLSFIDPMDEQLSNWYSFGTVSSEGYGVTPAATDTGRVYSTRIPTESDQVARLDASSGPAEIYLRPERGQSYATTYGFCLRWDSPLPSLSAPVTALADNEFTEVRFRQDHQNNYLSLRMMIPDSDPTQLYVGLWNVTGGIASKVGNTVVWEAPFGYGNETPMTIPIDFGSLPTTTQYTEAAGFLDFQLWVVDDDVYCRMANISEYYGFSSDWAETTVWTNVTLPDGPGLSFHQANGIMDVDAVYTYSQQPDLAPVRVSVEHEGRLIPPDLHGINTDNANPERRTVVVYPDPNHPQQYRLPYPPASNLANLAVEIREYDPVNREALELIHSGQPHANVSLQGNLLTLLGHGWNGPVQVTYWCHRQGNAKVPVTVNRTDYQQPEGRVVTSLRRFYPDLESEYYYPFVEYLQRGRRLQFMEPFDRVLVDYWTYGTRLQVQTRLRRDRGPGAGPTPRYTSNVFDRLRPAASPGGRSTLAIAKDPTGQLQRAQPTQIRM